MHFMYLSVRLLLTTWLINLFPQIRVYLNIIYTIVEVMRCADPGDSEDIAQIQEMFFVELSKYSEFKISVYKDMQEKLFFYVLSVLGVPRVSAFTGFTCQ